MDMDIDSPPETNYVSPRDQIVAKLAQTGVPEEYLRNFQSGLLNFVSVNVSSIPQLVQTILPSDEEVADFQKRSKAGSGTAVPTIKDHLRESMVWLQWLMFKDEPSTMLKYLAELNTDQRGVCGAVWGRNDIAYRCRTCEQDPTCALCGPCFEDGNHKDHDYSTIYTDGGCCDCGDITAWKRDGFCSRHKGSEQIQPLPEEIQRSVKPVLDALFLFWRDELMLANSICQERRESDDAVASAKFASDLTFVVVDMLLEFCKESESLLSFVSTRVFSCSGLLNVLVKTNRFLNSGVGKRLHPLLLKLLAEPSFKYEFAKAYLKYYPDAVNEAVKECSNRAFKDFAAISIFSVQIFMVPTLTERLVKEMNLLSMLFGCLKEIFVSTAGEDGRLQVSKWQSLYDTTIRVADDVRFVMSHDVVASYMLCTQPNLLKTWVKLLAFVQGVNPQKRETGIHVEEEIENTHFPFLLCYSTANINYLMVNGAFSDAPEQANDGSVISACEKHTDNCDSLRQPGWRLSDESPACCCATGTSTTGSKAANADSVANIQVQIPAPAAWLIFECLKAIELCLLADGSFEARSVSPSQGSSTVFMNNLSAWKKNFQKIRVGKYIFGRLNSLDNHQHPLHRNSDLPMDLDAGEDSHQEVELKGDGSDCFLSTSFGESCDREDYAKEPDSQHILTSIDWPNITYDVSSQEISLHLPLHRLLALLLQRALRRCYGESTLSIPSLSATYSNFFERILGQCHPLGFSAFIMEHPLRIRVFVAEVHAGMWKKNGETALLTCEWYRTVRWSEAGLELDLFTLQLCAALAPPDLYVNRILERFGLSKYLSLNHLRTSEYEPVLVREMLILIIQIVKERRFCRLTDSESLRRELIYKLVIGDATHSQIVKSLPHELAKLSGIQEILDAVASYSHPKGFNQGMYSLRWPCWKELDLYHPRWNSRDLQVAEERYVRFCCMAALTAQVPLWTNTYAPLNTISGVATCRVTLQIIRAVLFYAVFNDKGSESRAPDTVLIPALHLLSLALDICFQLRKSSDRSDCAGAPVPVVAFAVEEIENGLSLGVGRLSLLSLLVLLMKLHKKENVERLHDAVSFDLSPLFVSLLKKFAQLDSGIMSKLQQLAPELVNHDIAPNIVVDISLSDSDRERRKAKARQKQAAIMAKMRADQSKFLATLDHPDEALSSVQEVGNSVAVNEPEETTLDVCSLCHDSNSKIPLSFLILLEKSRLCNFIDRVVPSWDKVQLRHPEDHQVLIVENKENDQSRSTSSVNDLEVLSSSQLLQFVQNAISKFAYDGRPAEANAFLEFVKARYPSLVNIELPFISNDRRENEECRFGTLEQDMYHSVKAKMTSSPQLFESLGDLKGLSGEGVPGECADAVTILVGKYVACLSQERAEIPSASEQVLIDDVFGVSTEPASAGEGFGSVDCDGIYLSSCGHAVHQGCLDRYLSSLKERYTRRIVFEGGHIVDLDQGEFLCPVCRRLANCVLPTVAMCSPTPCHPSPTSSFNVGQLPLMGGSSTTSLELPQALFLLQSVAALVKRGDIFKAISLQNDSRLESRRESTYDMLSKMYFSRKRQNLVSGRTSRSAILWDTLRYSIISTEISARSGRTTFNPNISVSSLYKEFTSSGKFILSLLLKIAQSSRSENPLDVLQRFWGLKLFAESVSGVGSAYPSGTDGKGGNVFCILKDAEKEGSHIDIQFWKRAADPVLTHDPFSSLMWTLFCLPSPFLFCKESFISLVHIFYAVSIAQAIFTYMGNSGSFGKDQIGDIGSSESLINDISDMMKEFTCASKYFRSNHIDFPCGITYAVRSLTFPYLRRCALLERLLNSSTTAPFSDKDNELYGTSHVDYNMDELNDAQELENMFNIPSFSTVVKDHSLRYLVRRWFHHFHEEVKLQRFSRVFYCTPAVPFELMQLPHVYQDLLQRYIKQRCTNCKSVIEDPALCLLCGRLCSPNWKLCCRESGCHNHANACAAGTGVFLLIKKTSILLQRASRQVSWPSPYLDAFGEEDNEMRRGKPLFLNEERYAALTYMVASHGLDGSSKVLRQSTIGTLLLL